MTPITAPVSTFTQPRRALAAAALAALALTGCGSDGLGGSGTASGPAGAGAKVSATPSTAEQAAFVAMLDKVAQPCSSTGAPSGPTDKEPTGPQGDPSLPPGGTPPAEPIEPGAPTEPGARLSERDRCASVQHEQRIIQALQEVSEPTPAKVRKSLNRLGYVDERIHDLKHDGRTTRFYLDLRENGGRLCEAGVAAGEETDVTPCMGPATGSFSAKDLLSGRK
ncbi:hypothetical protein [Streptomyces shenzhenensis]|uniref:hypothetical protein n=1 Tax=Streptomyces shenzhenensis TaxID=943815 RepID=UPI001F158020|nr:hypothetical protein [Streptomyces shenzhenensis]